MKLHFEPNLDYQIQAIEAGTIPLAVICGGLRSAAADYLSRAIWWHNPGLAP